MRVDTVVAMTYCSVPLVSWQLKQVTSLSRLEVTSINIKTRLCVMQNQEVDLLTEHHERYRRLIYRVVEDLKKHRLMGDPRIKLYESKEEFGLAFPDPQARRAMLNDLAINSKALRVAMGRLSRVAPDIFSRHSQ